MGGNACDMTRVILLLGLISYAASTSLDSFPEARIIHMAAKQGDVEKVKAELKTDPTNAHARTVANITALHLGAAHPEVLSEILKSGGHCDAVDINNETPLMAVAREGFAGSVDVLLKHKADVSLRRNDGYTALMLAAMKGQVSTIPALLKADPNPNAVGPDGYSAVTMAAAGAVEDASGSVLQAILKTEMPKGRLDLSQPIQGGKTALMIVANNNQPKLVRLLLEAGASASGFDQEGQTPLMHAIMGACEECVVAILEAASGAASVNERDTKGWTALMLASRAFHGDTSVPRLLAKGADTNAQKSDGISALMLAAGQNRTATLGHLLEAGADPTLTDKEGYTALHIAASRDFARPCTVLLEGGASQTAINKEAETPFGLAVDTHMAKAVAAFREFNGEVETKGSSVVELNRAGLKEYQEKGDKPLLVEFYAPWCEHCKKFAPVYDEIGKTLAAEGLIHVIKADAATDSVLAGKNGVRRFQPSCGSRRVPTLAKSGRAPACTTL